MVVFSILSRPISCQPPFCLVDQGRDTVLSRHCFISTTSLVFLIGQQAFRVFRPRYQQQDDERAGPPRCTARLKTRSMVHRIMVHDLRQGTWGFFRHSAVQGTTSYATWSCACLTDSWVFWPPLVSFLHLLFFYLALSLSRNYRARLNCSEQAFLCLE